MSEQLAGKQYIFSNGEPGRRSTQGRRQHGALRRWQAPGVPQLLLPAVRQDSREHQSELHRLSEITPGVFFVTFVEQRGRWREQQLVTFILDQKKMAYTDSFAEDDFGNGELYWMLVQGSLVEIKKMTRYMEVTQREFSRRTWGRSMMNRNAFKGRYCMLRHIDLPRGLAIAAIFMPLQSPQAQGAKGDPAVPVPLIFAPVDAPALENIVVTASRRSTGATMLASLCPPYQKRRSRGQRSTVSRNSSTSLPGLSFAAKGTGQSMLSLRGVASDPASAFGSNAINGNATVGLYLDETSISTQRIQSRAAAIRHESRRGASGPAGNALRIGVALGNGRYISNAPSQEFEARVVGDMSSTAHGKENTAVDAMVNIPLGETLALRAVGYARDIDGFIDNVANRVDVRSLNFGGSVDKNVDSDRTYGGRAQLLWTPHHFSALGRLYYQHTKTGGVPTVDRANPIDPNDALLGKYEQSRLARENLRAPGDRKR